MRLSTPPCPVTRILFASIMATILLAFIAALLASTCARWLAFFRMKHGLDKRPPCTVAQNILTCIHWLFYLGWDLPSGPQLVPAMPNITLGDTGTMHRNTATLAITGASIASAHNKTHVFNGGAFAGGRNDLVISARPT